MRVEILTIFPEIFRGFLDTSLIKKAQEKGLLAVTLTNIRDFAEPPHYQVDDTPYGGGPGMVMRPEPLVKAIEAAKQRLPNGKVIIFTPAGKLFSQSAAVSLSREAELILVCGRYEGIDERVSELAADLELSIGDYVLMGGEVPAMVVLETATRLIDGVIGNAESLARESFMAPAGQYLEAPQYTRPPEFRGKKVPEVLLSGNHGQIADWRTKASLEKTRRIRPDLSGIPAGSDGG